jgi:hypothetical protein
MIKSFVRLALALSAVSATNSPTSVPTSSAPSSVPTSLPTSVPTEYRCKDAEYDVLLMDLFGDGWQNVEILITVDDVTHNHTMHCQNCSGMLHFESDSCKLNISMTSFGEPVTPWEVRWLVEHDNITYVGGWGSELVIRDHDVWQMGIIDQDPDSDNNKCAECSHPNPKPAPGPASAGTDKDSAVGPASKPPAKVRIDIYDEMSNGWFNKQGGSSGVCDSELCRNNTAESCPADILDVPDITTYPKYYIMNEKKTKLIHDGTICNPKRGVDICEEVMPYDGTFYFRVAGVEPIGDAATWKFCGREGGIDEELEFFMRHGKCVPGAQTTAKKYCDGLESVTTISATIFLTGIRFNEELTPTDTKLIENDMADHMLHADSVTVTEWNFVRDAILGNGVEVTLSAVLVTQSEELSHTNVVNRVESIQSQLASSMGNGNFLTELKSDLSMLPNSQADVLNHVSTVTLTNLRIFSESYESVAGRSPVNTNAGVSQRPASSGEVVLHAKTGLSSAVIASAAVVAALVVAVAGFIAHSIRGRSANYLPSDVFDSSHGL